MSEHHESQGGSPVRPGSTAPLSGHQGQGRPDASGADKTAEAAPEVSPAILERAAVIARRSGHELLQQTVDLGEACPLQRLNNALMDTFRACASQEAYALLFELNLRPFAMIAGRIMRMTGSRADVNDVLQETFLAVYRYPTKFRADKPNAFRNWSYSIIRNTVYRHLNKDAREAIPAELLADVLVDTRAASPPQATEDRETDGTCRRVYGLLLTLYIQAYQRDLTPRDRLALELVEIEKLGYREASERVGIRLENFKMVVCRARKKIFQALVRVLGTHRR